MSAHAELLSVRDLSVSFVTEGGVARGAEELGDRQLPGWTWRALAKVAELRGDQAAAEEHWRRSREVSARSGHERREQVERWRRLLRRVGQCQGQNAE